MTLRRSWYLSTRKDVASSSPRRTSQRCISNWQTTCSRLALSRAPFSTKSKPASSFCLRASGQVEFPRLRAAIADKELAELIPRLRLTPSRGRLIASAAKASLPRPCQDASEESSTKTENSGRSSEPRRATSKDVMARESRISNTLDMVKELSICSSKGTKARARSFRIHTTSESWPEIRRRSSSARSPRSPPTT